MVAPRPFRSMRIGRLWPRLGGGGMAAASAIAVMGITGSSLALAAGTGSWAVNPTPNATGTTSTELFGVTCVTASNCWAVGEENSLGPQTLIEHYNGSRWTTVSGPSANSNQLNGVTCVSASDCWAVGYYQPSGEDQITLTVHYNGSGWSTVSSPNTCGSCVNTGSDVLNAVACVGASDCWAVGTSDGSKGPQTLTERYNGTKWSIVSSPNPSSNYELTFNSVACPAANECWAVGKSNSQTLIEDYDGTAWKIVSSPNPSSTYELSVNGVTCAAKSECWAVGESNNQTLIEGYNGTAWSIVSSPNPSSTYQLSVNGVTCAATTACWAVGESNSQTLTEQYNGTSWSIVSSADTSGSNFLQGVACVSAGDCWAAGYDQFVPPSGVPQNLIEHSTGSGWSIVSSPIIPLPLDNYLEGTTCAVANFCFSVGYYIAQFGEPHTLIEYNGKIVNSPELGPLDNQLYGAACVSISDCFAVGYGDLKNNGVEDTLIQQYNGSGWAVVSSPNSGSGHNYLLSVTCVSATDCWAVGYLRTSPDINALAQTLIEQYNGTSWAVVTSPNVGTGNNFLNSVTCVSASDCWAVGDTVVSNMVSTVTQTLIEQYNGTSWSTVTSPNPPSATTSVLNGVTCTSATNCWAVGESRIQSMVKTTNYSTLIEQYNGSSWATVTSPNNGSNDNELNGVSCSTANFCVAAGFYNNGSVDRTLVEQSTGAGWTTASTPNVGSDSNALYGVTCVSRCWTVGTYINDTLGAYQTLNELHVGDPTRTTVSCSPNPDAVHQPTKCTASVADTLIPLGTPAGTVSWSGGTGSFTPKSCTLSSGSCSVTFTPSAASTQTITAKYAGDRTHAASQGSTTLHVT